MTYCFLVGFSKRVKPYFISTTIRKIMCSYILMNLDIYWNWQIARIISFITIIRCEYVTKSVVISHYTLQRYKIFGNKICCLDCIHGLNCIQYNMCSASMYRTIFVESRSKWTMYKWITWFGVLLNCLFFIPLISTIISGAHYCLKVLQNTTLVLFFGRRRRTKYSSNCFIEHGFKPFGC